MIGSLEVISGSMFSGKTTEILKRILWAKNGQDRDVLVLKPNFDNRYAETEIVSHDGLRSTALSVNSIPTQKISEGALVILDEVQFFVDPYFNGDIVDWVKTLLHSGVDVVVAGLDMDWQGIPFNVTAQFLAMADKVHKNTANCTVCGLPAQKTYKKVKNEKSVELGSTDIYEARCNKHWSIDG